MRTVDGSRSLSETAESGLEATGAAAPVTAVLDIIEGLKGQDQVFYPLNAVQVLSGWQAMLLSQELSFQHAVNLHSKKGVHRTP